MEETLATESFDVTIDQEAAVIVPVFKKDGLMQLSEMSWPEVQRLSPDTPVVIPIAAVEQHGHHLPLATDSLLLAEVVRRVQLQLSDAVLWLPLQWLGNSHHHMDFSGTLSAEPRAYLDLLLSLLENCLVHGFRRILLLNGHGGNLVPAAQAIFEMRQRYRTDQNLLLLLAAYWQLGKRQTTEPLEFEQSEMGHACEWETSMMLRLNPKLVGDYASAVAVDPADGFSPAVRAWTTKDRSAVGHIGYPHLASEEKGELLFTRFADGTTDLLQRMLQWDEEKWEGQPGC